MKFAEGDRVIYTSGNFGSGESNPLFSEYNIVGTVTSADYDSLYVDWDNGANNSYEEGDLELYNQEIQYEIC